METQQAERKIDSLILARTGMEDNYIDSDNIVSRTKFPESWLWSDVILPACHRQTPDCDTTSLTKNVPLQDSITTWQFTGISLSRTHGICVGEPLEVIVQKEFFIDLRLPYSAVRGEQLEIKAILHNYIPDPITVRVDLIEEEHVCSSASKRGKYRQEVNIGAQTTRAVPFIIIPMKEGTFNIEIKAAVKESSLHDGIRKKLLVVPEGVLVKSPQIIILDPTTKGVGGKQEVTLNSGIPEKDLVRNTPKSTDISVTGREQVSTLVENAINGDSIGTLIRQPSGCGEQNIARTTLPVIAATYLDKTNQWETLSVQKRNEALQHIKTGYQNELVYRKGDGSFAIWTDSKSSTWLTAYVAKVFAMADNLVRVEREHICEAIKFLILNAQQPDGLFREVESVSDRRITGGMTGADSDASMTAFCLIAMQESRTRCAASVNSLPHSISKAVNYLERRLPSLNNPYAVAMTSYALANENKLNKEILYKFASRDLSHWPTGNGHIYTLEATAYALLALVKAKAFEEAKPVVRWFSTQQMVYQDFGSTQATIMVYQAIAEYWASAKEPEYDLNVDIFIPGKSNPVKFNFNRDNHYATRTSKLSKGKARNIAKYEMNTVLSERGSLIIYLDKVSHTRPEEISFRIHQEMEVGFTQPAAVSIYEYYDQNCSMQNKEKITNEERTAKICESTENSIIDFAYKVRLEGFEEDVSTDIYKGKVLEVIKEGTLDVGPKNKTRTFLSYTYCRESLVIGTGKTYLIMGTSKDIHRDDKDQPNQYVLGERTWIEYWPTEAECQTQEHRNTCLGIEDMVQLYQIFGCQQ
ncbi:hypothetical protein PFLUV_G00092310 [Perca fluviatilis]|uniref:NTR domain-containing protein n=1 Tax=Perca fluviatilis TaxID=8168 RepID=A0A6A5FIY6_PERFL|nr:hypothetical protein PFLUV_G00092310 [Perca fluviatilis]